MAGDIPQPPKEYLDRLNAVLGSGNKKPGQEPQSVNLVKTREEIIAAIHGNMRVNACYTCPKNYADRIKADISYFAGFDPIGEPVFVAIEPPVFPYDKTLPAPQCQPCARIDEIDFAMAYRSLEKLVQE